MSGSIDKTIERIKNKQVKIEKFSDILDALESTEDKKKLLWKEIYENALTDRENAYALFTDLMKESQGNSANHAMFGQTMSKYLERMSKSNDQILRLAELIAKAEEKQEIIDPDDIFRKIKDG
ncbi:MAG: hypothetical protein CML56_04945 [Rhodobacteraceae bacterium]|nr:hypothetical protein [Paracoccaceae bacterium]